MLSLVSHCFDAQGTIFQDIDFPPLKVETTRTLHPVSILILIEWYNQAPISIETTLNPLCHNDNIINQHAAEQLNA